MPERSETWTPFFKHIPGGQIPRVKVSSCRRGFVNCTLGSAGSPGCSLRGALPEAPQSHWHCISGTVRSHEQSHCSVHPVLLHSSQPQGLAFLLGISRTARPLFLLFPPLATLLVLSLQQTPFCSCPFTLPHFLSCPCTLYSLFPVSRMSSFLPASCLVRLLFLWGPVKHRLLRELPSSTTPLPCPKQRPFVLKFTYHSPLWG